MLAQRKEATKSACTGHSESSTTATCPTPGTAFTQTEVRVRTEHPQAQCTEEEGEQGEEGWNLEIVAARWLCCDHLRMSIRLISFKRPIIIAGGKEKNEESFWAHKPILNDISSLLPFSQGLK